MQSIAVEARVIVIQILISNDIYCYHKTLDNAKLEELFEALLLDYSNLSM